VRSSLERDELFMHSHWLRFLWWTLPESVFIDLIFYVWNVLNLSILKKGSINSHAIYKTWFFSVFFHWKWKKCEGKNSVTKYINCTGILKNSLHVYEFLNNRIVENIDFEEYRNELLVYNHGIYFNIHVKYNN